MYNIKDFNKYAKEYNEFIDMCRNRYFNINCESYDSCLAI